MNASSRVDYQQLENSLQAMLGQHAAAACMATADGVTDWLTPSERIAVAAAVPHRQREFAAGRKAARAAMRRLGRAEASVPANPDRSPRWPDGLVGSISHCGSTCVAVLALESQWRSAGIDIEPDQDLSSDLWPFICRPDELQRVREVPEAMHGRWVRRVFSAKEAYYKWVFPSIRSVLDFHDVAIEFEPMSTDGRFIVRPCCQTALAATPSALEGRLITTQGLVISLMIH